MRKLYPPIVTLVLTLLCLGSNGLAQSGQISARDAEFKTYNAPASEFVRRVDSSGTVLFRAPANWKEEAAQSAAKEGRYRFTGPASTLLAITVGTIPDGLPLGDYLAAILQQLRSVPGAADSLTVRRTEMSGLEAREIMFELSDESGNLSRRLIWCVVDGPTAVSVVLVEPKERIAEIEPYFSAVINSLVITDKDTRAAFEALRTTAIKESKPSRVDELQAIVRKINGLDSAERSAAAASLKTIFANAPDAAIDLVLDRRPLVRAAAIEAIAGSKNHVLEPFLLQALQDQESFVSERAVRVIASMPNAVPLLRDACLNWFKPEQLARVWPFLDRNSQLQIAAEIFAEGRRPPGRTQVSSTASTSNKTGVTVLSDVNNELGLLTLLGDISAKDFPVPLAHVLKAGNDALTAAALQVALERRESLPAAELLKLLSSNSGEVQHLAALNLAESGTMSDVNKIEDFAKGFSAAPPNSNADRSKAANRTRVADDLRATISKIRFREQLANATAEQKTQLLKRALADPQLADWAWAKYVGPEGPSPTSSGEPKHTNNAQISSLGENAFPAAVAHYVAIPNPASLFQKFGDSLNGIQMDSASAQANLVLILNGMHLQLARQLQAQTDRSVFEYSGVKTDAPIALAAWRVDGAPRGVPSARRKAIILRVADRERFERALTLYQKKIGSFEWLPEYVAGGARLLAALPAILPLSAEMMLKEGPRDRRQQPILSYDFISQTEIDGVAVKVIGARHVSTEGAITNDLAYMLYVGDVALMAPNLESLRDVLRRVRDGGPALATNVAFKAALGAQTSLPAVAAGDAVYLSNPDEVFATPAGLEGPHVRESGALKISNSHWESFYHLTFDESTWSKPLIRFQPDELIAPKELLPSSTVAYYFMKVDLAAAQREWSKDLFHGEESRNFVAAWGIDFEKEVVPEIDAECGIALLGLPDLSTETWQVPWVAFVKLKSEKLQRALAEGRLFKGAEMKQDVAKVKLGTGNLFVAVRNGFLIAADSETVITLLDQKEKLVASRDFAKAAKRAANGVVAFGGYSLDAVNRPRSPASDSVQAQRSDIILSLTRAFHSANVDATAAAGNIDARSSISMDREGRYSVAELQALTANSEPAFAVVEATGLPIVNQDRIKNLKLRVHAKAAGEIDRIVDDVALSFQKVEQRSDMELQLRVQARRPDPKEQIQIPITGIEFKQFLQATKEIRSDDQSVIDKAREIAGADRDAWSVARKLSDWTYKNLKWKHVDADAAQTLATLEADCYEFSKLYVAMARSLGLPARIVSGLAYSGSAFGGHAWVEVYAGNWIEIDPTWGTDFVDATHLRDSSGAIITYAALNLVKFEVLEAAHGVEEFQLGANTLVKKLCEELQEGRTAALHVALDLSVLTDEVMGAGSWLAMNDAERDQMSAAYQRVVNEILSFKKKEEDGELRLLAIKDSGNRAQALLMQSLAGDELLLKLSLVRREGAWLLAEIVQTDTGLKVIADTLQPTIKEIVERRSGHKTTQPPEPDFRRVLIAFDTDPKSTIDLANRALKNHPEDQRLRYLKSLALANAERHDETVKLWTELSDAQPPLPIALLSLARHYETSEDVTQQKKAVELYVRYVGLEPDDPRARTSLANLYESLNDLARAENEYRAAIERDNSIADTFIDLASFYAQRKRFAEATAVVDEGAKRTGSKDDLFGSLMFRLVLKNDPDTAEGFAASQPKRMAQSALANLHLARVRMGHGRSTEALPLLRKAALLDKQWPDPYDLMSEVYRKVHNWSAALTASDTAIRLQPNDADAHYERACALARLGRRNEAMTALGRSIDLDSSLAAQLEEEQDLKSLSALPEFKKLIPKQEKQ